MHTSTSVADIAPTLAERMFELGQNAIRQSAPGQSLPIREGDEWNGALFGTLTRERAPRPSAQRLKGPHPRKRT